MCDAATSRQKQFLRWLGHRNAEKLTKQQASRLIETLLAEEKESGKTFPCPYCKARFGPRPKRTKKCPSCGNTIIQLSGKFYTEKQADEHCQKDWFKDSRNAVKSETSQVWKEDRKFRKEFDESLFIGYSIEAGPSCPHAKYREGMLILIEDAYAAPELLPPFDGCRYDSCECD